MAQNIDFDKYLAAAGFGESVSLGKRSRRVKPKAPNPVAYAESYAFIRNDATRMELEKLRMHVKVAQIKASGEGLEDIKNKVVDTVKSGASKVKKTLIELYEKAIRFFTETVRYFFSNEKKIGKTLAAAKASLKRTAKESKKDDEFKSFDFKNYDASVEGLFNDYTTQANEITAAGNASGADAESVRDKTDELITTLKEKLDEKKEALKNFTNIESSAKVNMTFTTGEVNTKKALELLTGYLTTFREASANSMKGINKEIRDLQKELKELKKDWKENKDHNEDATKEFQVKRAVITNKVKYANAYKGVNDNFVGVLLKATSYVIAERAKCTK